MATKLRRLLREVPRRHLIAARFGAALSPSANTRDCYAFFVVVVAVVIVAVVVGRWSLEHCPPRFGAAAREQHHLHCPPCLDPDDREEHHRQREELPATPHAPKNC